MIGWSHISKYWLGARESEDSQAVFIVRINMRFTYLSKFDWNIFVVSICVRNSRWPVSSEHFVTVNHLLVPDFENYLLKVSGDAASVPIPTHSRTGSVQCGLRSYSSMSVWHSQ